MKAAIGKYAEHEDQVFALEGRRGNQQRNQPGEEHEEHQIGPPQQFDRDNVRK